MKLSTIAELVNGKLEGKDIDINSVSNLDLQKPGSLAYAENKKTLNKLKDTEVAALVIPEGLEYTGKPVIRVKNPKMAFIKVLEQFDPTTPYSQKQYPQTYIEPSAKIADDVTVFPFTTVMENSAVGEGTILYSQVFIGRNVKIGKNCVIKSGVKIDDRTVIGDNVIIHHNTVIGGDGFGYVQDEEKRNHKIPQIGNIVIESDVEIGACVTVDRAAFDSTIIHKGVKIDNLVQIAHNVEIGENSIVVSQVGIAGSSSLGKNCILAGQVGVADHVHIGDRVVIMAQSGIDKKKIEDDKILFGSPARDFMFSKRIYAAQEKLPELVKTVHRIKKILGLDNE